MNVKDAIVVMIFFFIAMMGITTPLWCSRIMWLWENILYYVSGLRGVLGILGI